MNSSLDPVRAVARNASDADRKVGVRKRGMAASNEPQVRFVTSTFRFGEGDHITNDNTLTLGGTADANATAKVYDGSTS